MPTPSWFPLIKPQVSAVILAGSAGTRMFPISSNELPKHLLPIGGIPSIVRLMSNLSAFPEIVVAIATDDQRTVEVLSQTAGLKIIPNGDADAKEGSASTEAKTDVDADADQQEPQQTSWTFQKENQDQKIRLIRLADDCFGSVDALRYLENQKAIADGSHIVVFPGDLVLLDTAVLEPLIQINDKAGCHVVLVDVGEQDEHGIPLKESSKSKKGGLAREEDDIDYIALSYHNAAMGASASDLPHLVWKQAKIDVEADEDMTGNSAKVELYKSRIRGGKLVVRKDWNDVHVYSFAPWIRKLYQLRTNLVTIQGDLLPLLISRQFKGRKAALGSFANTVGDVDDDDAADKDSDAGQSKSRRLDADLMVEEPFHVSAIVVPNKTALRSNTISAYLYACKEVVAKGSSLTMPKDAKWNGKFQTLVLPGTTLASKLTMRASTIGAKCQVGAKCRLNGVVVMDNVTIGENCSLQNTVIASGAVLGNNCSLSDCQVGPKRTIDAQTKEKGEAFVAELQD